MLKEDDVKLIEAANSILEQLEERYNIALYSSKTFLKEQREKIERGEELSDRERSLLSLWVKRVGSEKGYIGQIIEAMKETR